MSPVQLLSVTESDLGNVQLLCGHSPTYRRGYVAKQTWVRDRLREGMRYILVRDGRSNAGMVEYLPGEFAWRPVDAQGYLFIHCFWIVGRNRDHGYGRMLLEACLEDAKGTNGVAVMVSKAHWLPTPKLFSFDSPAEMRDLVIATVVFTRTCVAEASTSTANAVPGR